MNRVFLVLFLLFAAVVVAYAQTASPPSTAAVSASPTPATAPAPTPARTLAPFVAAYEVYRGGKAFGDATL
jgi:hypothetical protein